MSFGLVVAQLQGLRPAFDGPVIGQEQVVVETLQVVEQAGVVDGDGGLPGQGLQEVQPLVGLSGVR